MPCFFIQEKHLTGFSEKIKKEDTTLLYHAVALFARLTDFF